MIELEGNRRWLYQWELDKRVIISDFPPDTRVEFSKRFDRKDSGLPVMSYEENGKIYADVPNSLLQDYGYISVKVLPSANEIDYVPEEMDIKVVRREKPDDYVYTETKTISYADLEKRVSDLEKNGGAGTGTVKSVNSVEPDESGNVEIEVGTGRKVAGETFTPYEIIETGVGTDSHTVTETPLDPVEAGEGAEISNDYDTNVATGYFSTARGYKTQATGNYAEASGWWTRSGGQCAHAEGLLSVASGNFAHAEGTRTRATANNSHSEGDSTLASGRQSHAEGQGTVASGFCSHAEGSDTQATNYYAHAEGLGTIAAGRNQSAMGKYNVKDTTSLLIVGNGTSDSKRSNAHTVGPNGEGWYKAGIKVGGTGYSSGAKSVLLTGDAVPVPATVAVGQVIVVKAVDANGKPTAWEAVNMPTGGATDEQIAKAVADYLVKNPVTGTARVADVDLLTAKWQGDTSPYYQVVTIAGITAYSQVDLTPSVEQLSIFHEKDLSFVTENEDGVVTVYAIGQKPTNDYTIQATIREVRA